MRLPRDLTGHELIVLLPPVRISSDAPGRQSHSFAKQSARNPHNITIPNHQSLRLGTLNAILIDVANYLNIQRAQLEQELFSK